LYRITIYLISRHNALQMIRTLTPRARANSTAQKTIALLREAGNPKQGIPEMKGILEENIQQLAYRLYEKRGCGDGHAVDDWLRAEREIRAFASRSGGMEVESQHSDASPSRSGNEEHHCS
jgi:Protein of unknown function (DUF2934)